MKYHYWSERDVEWEIFAKAAELGGAMPSCNELGDRLHSVIAKRGGIMKWAERLGLPLRPHAFCSDFGGRWEHEVARLLSSRGRTNTVMPHRHPFDIEASGVRINVKVSRWHDYGHMFWIGETWRTCDVFALVLLAEDEKVPPTILWVPASECRQKSVTMSPFHRFNAMTSMDVLGAQPHPPR